jgi:TusA-related sulfurtransferase
MTVDLELDATGMACPVPIVKTAKKMREMSPGQVLRIISDDEGFKADIVAWCDSTGNEFLSLEEVNGKIYGYVKKVG